MSALLCACALTVVSAAVNCLYSLTIKPCNPTCNATDDTVGTVNIIQEAQNGGTQCIRAGEVLSQGQQIVLETCPKKTGPECEEPCPTECAANVQVCAGPNEGLVNDAAPVRKLLADLPDPALDQEEECTAVEVAGVCSGIVTAEPAPLLNMDDPPAIECPLNTEPTATRCDGESCGFCCIPPRECHVALLAKSHVQAWCAGCTDAGLILLAAVVVTV